MTQLITYGRLVYDKNGTFVIKRIFVRLEIKQINFQMRKHSETLEILIYLNIS